MKLSPAAPRYIYNFTKTDLPGLISHLQATLPISSFPTEVNTEWSFLRNSIHISCDRFIPKVKLSSHPSPKWFNSNIRHQLNCMHSLRRQIHKNPTPYKLSKLKCLESKLQHQIQSAKSKFDANLVFHFHSRPNLLFRHLNYLSRSSSIPQTVYLDSSSSNVPPVKAHLFNSFFNSVLTSSDFVLPPMDKLPSPSSQLNRIAISESDVLESLSSLDHSKAPGCDDIYPFVLKFCAGPLLSSVTQLLSSCLLHHTIPQEWKIHKICPIHKKVTSLMLETIDQSLCYAFFQKF